MTSRQVSASPRDRGDQVECESTERVKQKAGPGIDVFCGRIPWEMSEDEIRDMFAVYGPITEMKLGIDPETRHSKGFAFISFLKEEDGLKAISSLHGMRMWRGQYLKVSRRILNTRLFVGKIPKDKDKKEIHRAFAVRTDGLKEVIIYKLPDDERCNRGFCFLDYESYNAAASAKRKLSRLNTKVWGCEIHVDWADAVEKVDADTMANVRILYARNISALASEYDLTTLFASFGHLERVKKIKDFAFIHFESREDASRAKETLNGYKLYDVAIELKWAIPPVDKGKRHQILQDRNKRLNVMQNLRAAGGVVNPFYRPMGWNNGDEYLYATMGGGGLGNGRWIWPEWHCHQTRVPPSTFFLQESDLNPFSGSIPKWNYKTGTPSGYTRSTAADRVNWRGVP